MQVGDICIDTTGRLCTILSITPFDFYPYIVKYEDETIRKVMEIEIRKVM